MLKRRVVCLVLILVMLVGTVSAAGAKRSPYAIKVNRAMNTVTVYTQDENGQYTVPVKAMICSTARSGYVTPLGTFTLADYRSEWRLMLDGTYGQYATCFYGNYLFHSICYADDSHDAMVREAYNDLGTAASMGCVRLETKDAKWIFDNCPAGTKVTIYDDASDPGPLGKPERTVDVITEQMHNGWDPTDPAKGNPWNLEEVKSLELPESLTIAAGVGETLAPELVPKTAMLFWSSSNEKVARVDAQGRVTALSEGEAEIVARGLNGTNAACTITVEGELLPYDDLIPGAWYYPEVRRALEDGLFLGRGERTFSPNDAITRAMLVQVLYTLEGKPIVPQKKLTFEDVAQDAWYRDAVAWATAKKIVSGSGGNLLEPDKPLTRQELSAILWRFAGKPQVSTDLTAYSDADRILPFAKTALSWMTEEGLMHGSDGRLLPDKIATRAETAAILVRAIQGKVLRFSH